MGGAQGAGMDLLTWHACPRGQRGQGLGFEGASRTGAMCDGRGLRGRGHEGRGRGRGRQKSGWCVGRGLGQGQALVWGRGRRKCGRCDARAQHPCLGSWLLQLLWLLRRWPLTLSLLPSLLPWLPLSLLPLMPPLMLMLMLSLMLLPPPAFLRLRPALQQTSDLTPAPAAWTGQGRHACGPYTWLTPPPPSTDHYPHHLPHPWFPDTSGLSLLRSHHR